MSAYNALQLVINGGREGMTLKTYYLPESSLADRNKSMLFFMRDSSSALTAARALLEMSTLARFKKIESLVIVSCRSVRMLWEDDASSQPFITMFPALRDVHVLSNAYVSPAFFKLPPGAKWRTVTYAVGRGDLPYVRRGVSVETLVLTLPADEYSWTWDPVGSDGSKGIESWSDASDRVLIASDRIEGALPADPKVVRLLDATPLWTGEREAMVHTVRKPLVWSGQQEHDDDRSTEVLLPNGMRVPSLPNDTLELVGRVLHKYATA